MRRPQAYIEQGPRFRDCSRLPLIGSQFTSYGSQSATIQQDVQVLQGTLLAKVLLSTLASMAVGSCHPQRAIAVEIEQKLFRRPQGGSHRDSTKTYAGETDLARASTWPVIPQCDRWHPSCSVTPCWPQLLPSPSWHLPPPTLLPHSLLPAAWVLSPKP